MRYTGHVKPAVVPNRIELDDRGRPWLAGLNIRVEEIVELMHAWAPTPEEIHEHLPHLPLADIHAALSYYYDHKDEIDRSIDEKNRELDRLQAEAGESPLEKRLRDAGLLRR